ILGALLLGGCGFGAWYLAGGAQGLDRALSAEPQPARSRRPPRAPAPPPSDDPQTLSLERAPGAVADPARLLSHFSDTLAWQAKSFAEELGVDGQIVALRAPDLPAEQLAPQLMELR